MLRELWYSDRLRNGVFQAVLLGGLIWLLFWIGGNTVQNLAERGIRTGYEFLQRPARFPISETVLRYSPSDSFFWAYVVGLANTLWLSFLTILFATIGGLALALARLSGHPLLSRLAGIYVTVFRNVPLIVQLLFFYGVATSLFPPVRQALNPLPGLYLSLRGVYAPGLVMGPGSGTVIAVAVLLALVLLIVLRHWAAGQGRLRRWLWGFAIFLPALVLVWLLAGRPIALEAPQLHGLNFRGGLYLSPEFSAIIIGLTLYTTAFTGEIIRGGIEAVGKGQWEGGRALGVSERHIMFRIILPQALRVIVPPMTSQYLSTVKNTTLAVAVGYPELGLVVNTVINQTGQALESILIMLGVFLTISLSVSALMNYFNARIALVER
ncbi:amino acid ABC transporter permease [Nitratireductor indicus C115]|uniref:Amino acid ABC transporter permease n=1 Tax=Nitratireductor indicus C115 TaxID=1231190 RepID=K2P7J9_9HYPH|nr:ABC transporter permease subunit [Nitratireductor indicus]EKF43196.1 amino acid ABC transporter permease [Nitratireductor indicus C115]SFQ53597.1 general L-amino acid transport system permease protein [Nitratireductor indicus]